MSFRDLYSLPAMYSRLESSARYGRTRRYADMYLAGRYTMFSRNPRAVSHPVRFVRGNDSMSQAYRCEALTNFVSARTSDLRAGYDRSRLSDLVNNAIAVPRRLATFSRIIGAEACQCQNCGAYHTTDSSENVRGYGQVCEICIEEDFVMTEDTQRYMHRDHVNVWENGDYYEAEEESRTPSVDADDGICGYHGHPHRNRKLVFHKPDDSDPHKADPCIRIGVEWEMCCEDSDARRYAAEKLDETTYALGETDGSLDEETGMEVITGYSTIATVNRWMSEIHKLCSPDASEDCGIHVNISGLSDRAFVGLAYFLNNFRDFNHHIAGRWDCSYAYCANANTLERAYNLVSGSHDKYLHTNMRGWSRDDTRWMEVRIFKGTTSKSIAMARVQFTYALAAYCETLLPEEYPSPESFISWLNDNAEARALVPEFLESFRGHLARFAPAIMLNAVQEITVPVTNAPPQIAAPVLVRYAAAGDIETLEPNEDGIETAPRTAVRRTRPTTQVSGVRGEPIRRDYRNYSQWRGAHNRWLRERGVAGLQNVDYAALEARIAAFADHVPQWPFDTAPADSPAPQAPADLRNLSDDQLLVELQRPADADVLGYVFSAMSAGGLVEEAAELSQSINS